MFAVADKKNLHPSIQSYIETPFVKSFKLVRIGNAKPKYEFEYGGSTFSAPGIHYTLRKKFYPTYKHTRVRRKGRQKKGSSKKIGISVMKNLLKYVETGKKPRQWMAKMLINYFEITLKQSIQAVELPVYISSLKCATQIDVITMDLNKVLYVWEVKTGYPVSKRKPGKLTWYTTVPNITVNHWELQRHFSTLGLSESIPCVCIENSRVVNIYEEVKTKKKIKHVKARKIPVWAKSL